MPPARQVYESPRGVAATGSLSLRRKFMSDKLASSESVSLGKLMLRLDRNGAFAREISVGGEELFRGIGFVVRDANWGTPTLTGEALLLLLDDRATVKSGGRLDIAGDDL